MHYILCNLETNLPVLWLMW